MTGGQLDEALAAVLQHIESTAVPQLTLEAEASGVNQAPSGEAESDLVQHPAHDQPAAAQPAVEAGAAGSQMVEEPGCVFCGSLGNSDLCGLLQPAVVNGVPVMVHHLCALWAPQVYQQEGSQQYINLEEEYRRAERHVCTACGYTGAAIGCTEPGCKCTYHLPCAIQTPNVFLDVDAFELWCPVHADNEDDDMSDDYGSVQTSGRGRVRATAVSRRQRAPRGDVGGEVQRARTDWQKRDDNTWVKVVPPWWAEHKTVHFASKVYKELFRSAPSVVIVDSTGTERLCTLQTESRNDTRQQYTLRGRFAEFWEAAGVQAGDTLSFRYDPATAKVTVLRYAPAPSGVAEQGSVLSQPAATETTSVRIKQENSVDLSTRGVSQQGSHPNRWMELNDGWCIKTVYKSTIAHQQCPVAGWLFRKLYGRLPSETDKAVMVDADLGTEYRFDVNFIGAANVHYITGRNFGAWMRESGLRAQEQIRVKKDSGRVLIQRVPSDMKVHVDFSNGRSTRASARDRVTPPTSAGGTGPHSGGGSGNHSNPIMEALDSLAAAAGFAAVHGTPAIAAALAAPPAAAAAAAAAAVAAAAAGALPMLVQQQEQQLLQAGQQPGAPPSGPAAAAGLVLGEELQPQQSVRGAAELTLGKRRRTSTVNDSALGQLPVGGQGCGAGSGSLVWAPPFYQPNGQHLAGQSRQYPAQPFSPSKWESSGHPHMQMYQALLSMVGKYTWGAEEQDLLLKFKARYGRLDDVGREITFFNIRECHEDQEKLRTVLKVFAE